MQTLAKDCCVCFHKKVVTDVQALKCDQLLMQQLFNPKKKH